MHAYSGSSRASAGVAETENKPTVSAHPGQVILPDLSLSPVERLQRVLNLGGQSMSSSSGRGGVSRRKVDKELLKIPQVLPNALQRDTEGEDSFDCLPACLSVCWQ